MWIICYSHSILPSITDLGEMIHQTSKMQMNIGICIHVINAGENNTQIQKSPVTNWTPKDNSLAKQCFFCSPHFASKELSVWTPTLHQNSQFSWSAAPWVKMAGKSPQVYCQKKNGRANNKAQTKKNLFAYLSNHAPEYPMVHHLFFFWGGGIQDESGFWWETDCFPSHPSLFCKQIILLKMTFQKLRFAESVLGKNIFPKIVVEKWWFKMVENP